MPVQDVARPARLLVPRPPNKPVKPLALPRAGGRLCEEVSEAAGGGIQLQANRLSSAFSLSDHDEWLHQMEQQEEQSRSESGHDGLPHMQVDAEDDGEEDGMNDITISGLGSGLGSVTGSNVMPASWSPPARLLVPRPPNKPVKPLALPGSGVMDRDDSVPGSSVLPVQDVGRPARLLAPRPPKKPAKPLALPGVMDRDE